MEEVKSNLRTPLYNFLIGKLQTPKGLTIQDALALSEKHLERSHQYIQWCFPLENKSFYMHNNCSRCELVNQEFQA